MEDDGWEEVQVELEEEVEPEEDGEPVSDLDNDHSME